MFKETILILIFTTCSNFYFQVSCQSFCTNPNTNITINFNKNISVCCNGTLFAGNTCCGSLGYNAGNNSSKICCNQNGTQILGKGNLCCNGLPYYNNSQVCCLGLF